MADKHQGQRAGLRADSPEWDTERGWVRLLATEGDDAGDDVATMPTPQPPGSEDGDDSIDLRFELENLRLSLNLTDERETIQVDESGRFEIRRELGRGAMGVVYEAHDTALDYPVALKVVGAVAPGRKRLKERLVDEARALAKIQHDNVLRVRDVGKAVSGEPFIALDYIQGPTLRKWQAEQSVDEIIDAYIHAAKGVAAAHEVEVIHRDFKPDNVLFDTKKERVVVVDFGLAGGAIGEDREPEGLPTLDETTGVGTPPYMAPEQSNERADTLCDQYALCVSLWEAIAGERPFDDQLKSKKKRVLPPPPPQMPIWLRWVLARGLANNPDDRFEDMQGLILALDRGRRWNKYTRRGLLASTLIAAVVGVMLVLKPGPCDAAAKPMQSTWDDATRIDVRDALMSLDLDWTAQASEHVLETLDKASSAWSTEATKVCEDQERDGPSPLLTRKHACLEGWHERMRVTIALLREGDADLAGRVVGLLDPLIAAEDMCAIPRPEIDSEVRRLLTEAESLEQIREFEDARQKAEKAVEFAAQAQPCIEGNNRSYEAASAYFRLGHVLGGLESWAEAKDALQTASNHALACGDDWTAFDIRVYEAGFIYPQSSADSTEYAQRLLADADSLLVAAAGDVSTTLSHAELRRMEGLMLLTGDSPDYEAVVGAFEQARHQYEANPRTPLFRLVWIHHNLGQAYQEAGRYAEASSAYARATELLDAAVGSEYPEAKRLKLFIDLNQGLVALEEGKLDRARQLLSDAAEHGDPLVVVRAWSGFLQARLQAALAAEDAAQLRDIRPLGHQLADWLEAHDSIPWRPRGEALTTAGQVLLQSSVADGAIDDADSFTRGEKLVNDGIRLWEKHEPAQVPFARYILASSLFDGGRLDDAQVIIDDLLEEDLEGLLGNVIKELSGKIERERQRLETLEAEQVAE